MNEMKFNPQKRIIDQDNIGEVFKYEEIKRRAEKEIFIRPADPNEMIIGNLGRGKSFNHANQNNASKLKEISSNSLVEILPSTSSDA